MSTTNDKEDNMAKKTTKKKSKRKTLDPDILRKVLNKHPIKTLDNMVTKLQDYDVYTNRSMVNNTFHELNIKYDENHIYHFPTKKELDYQQKFIENAIKLNEILSIDEVHTVILKTDPEIAQRLAIAIKSFMEDIVLYYDVRQDHIILYIKGETNNFLNIFKKCQERSSEQIESNKIKQKEIEQKKKEKKIKLRKLR
ncbi:hypothetical protein [Sporolactobacillus laevolacticus]|uniref:Uncharacterized protein n=1 Tax=Sporolactobacillus laevolacticus DSM 442 TaxID=1395513 RepID=V6J5J4_9BACL|nr:hypothetical protein [Sporolactobacillus laevolacticus]EST12004.1 hypothetical protein P343_09935 [Sporolactobacillus laevolacticus DSM 442]